LQESLEPVGDFEMGDYREPEPEPEAQLYFETEQDPELELYSIPYSGTAFNAFCPEEDGYQDLEEYSAEEPDDHEVLYKPPFQEESELEHCIREEVMSDESCHDLDEMDECLRVEIEENLSISTPLTPSFIITSSPTEEPLKHEMSANNVIILDPRNDLTSGPTPGKDSMPSWPGGWKSEDNSSNLIILETSNVIIRSASEFSLNKSCEQPEEKMFLNNPFFKLRSRSSISLVDEEIKMVKQREEELRKERANLYGKDRFSTENVLTHHMDTLAFDKSGMSADTSIPKSIQVCSTQRVCAGVAGRCMCMCGQTSGDGSCW
uniref:Uncharacterized protein n=1 Tax=Oryzias sinensis TaxID=183150 RepID=A0A8C8DQX3_9TELE